MKNESEERSLVLIYVLSLVSEKSVVGMLQ